MRHNSPGWLDQDWSDVFIIGLIVLACGLFVWAVAGMNHCCEDERWGEPDASTTTTNLVSGAGGHR